MKKLLYFTILVSTISTQAQTINGGFLDINNIKAGINADGSLFNSYGTSFVQEFEVPKGSGRHTFFSDNLWIGGVDASSTIKLGAQTYRQTGTDFFPGPLNSSAMTNASTMAAFNRVWKVDKCGIDTYLTWLSSGSVGANPTDSATMEAIATWPAFSPYGAPLAPFVDANLNGVYDPFAGDYPLIKGDQAVFFVYNDIGNIHTETGGAAIGVEIQGMAYGYSCTNDSALYNTIFTNYKIINRSSFRLDSVFIGNWSDFDIGSASDDFVGSDVTRSTYYGYNGDLVDDFPPAGQLTYGANPPSQGVVFLQGPYADPNGIDDPASSTPNGTNYGDLIVDNERLGMSKFVYYNNDGTVVGNPSGAVDYYNYLGGYWRDGTSMTYGGVGHLTGVPCDYMYPGTSDPLYFGTNGTPEPNWSEETSGDVPADRRGLGSSGPFTFQPGAVQDITFAYVYGRATSGGNLASVAVMKERIDSVKQKFNAGITTCGCVTSTGIHNYEDNNSVSIYPNPATDNIIINYTSSSKNVSVKIYDATGRLVKVINNTRSGENNIGISELDKGLYLINIMDGKTSVTKRFIKE